LARRLEQMTLIVEDDDAVEREIFVLFVFHWSKFNAIRVYPVL
jgi:hypothetical protein